MQPEVVCIIMALKNLEVIRTPIEYYNCTGENDANTFTIQYLNDEQVLGPVSCLFLYSQSNSAGMSTQRPTFTLLFLTR